MAAPRQPDHNHENPGGDLDLPKAVPGSSLWTAPGLEFSPSLACHSALLSSGFLHVSHNGFCLCSPGPEAENPGRQEPRPFRWHVQVPTWGQGDCPSLPRAPRNLIQSVARRFRLDGPGRGHLGSSKIRPDSRYCCVLRALIRGPPWRSSG